MRIFHRCLLKIINIFGINSLFRFLNRNKVIILWYHGICNDSFRLLSGYDERHIQKSNFCEQLRFLNKKGYKFFTMSELLDVFQNKKKIKKIVVLTFDDGYKNVIVNAYPIMKEFNAKGCFFIISNLIGKDELLWTDFVETVIRNSKSVSFQFIYKGQKINYLINDNKSSEKTMQTIKYKLRSITDKERLEHLKQFYKNKNISFPKEFLIADWSEIKSLDSKILEIGSHSKNHPNLPNLSSTQEIVEEIVNSKNEIENNLGHKINHFCYPAGDYNNNLINYLKEYGYKSGVTIKHGFNDQTTNLYKLKRIEAPEDFLEFKSRISGSYYFLMRVKKFLLLNDKKNK